MRLLYVTKALPFGATEAFILPEVADHAAHGWEVWLAPLSRGELKHAEARDLLSRTLDQPLVSPVVLAGCLRGVLRAPGRAAGLLWRVLRARTPVLALRNLAVFPKAVWLSEEVRRHRFEHVHIHWAAAPATLGAVAAELAGVPFSLTAHRYDIAQNNLLAWKSAHACFVRVIDEPGREEFAARLPPGARPPQVLHMGVTVAPDPAPSRAGALSPLRLATAARLVAKKGHADLLRAVRVVLDLGVAVELDVFGDGPLRSELEALAVELGVAAHVSWRGTASHGDLLRALRSGRYDAGVLPSVTADDGDKEGVPVFLIECMGAGLPVVSTPNGGIPELAGGGCGVLTPERDPRALGAALARLARDEDERRRLAAAGRARVLEAFEIGACMRLLREWIACAPPTSAATPRVSPGRTG